MRLGSAQKLFSSRGTVKQEPCKLCGYLAPVDGGDGILRLNGEPWRPDTPLPMEVVRSVILKPETLRFDRRISENVWYGMKLRSNAERNSYMAEHIRFQVQVEILSAFKRTACTYPKTWLDAFKLRWFPKWALRRWPAKEVTVEAALLFPEINIPRNEFMGRSVPVLFKP